MTQQRRPLSGGASNGSPIALAAAGTTVHTIPAVSNERVGPVTDQIALFLGNTTGAAIVASVSIAGVAFSISVPANSILEVLDEHPVLGSVSAATTIAVSHAGANDALVAWGSFTRA
jgi:hypothetical protein